MPTLGPLPKVIGHRGAAAHAPENTLAGIRKAAALGVGMIEFDAKLTADGVPVLMHDDKLDRTTDAKGPVREISLACIRTLDAGSWFGPGFRAEPVPTLAEALELAVSLGLAVNLEIKACPGREVETARAALAVARDAWPADRPPPLVSSFERASLVAARDVAPDWPRGFLFDRLPADWQEQIAALEPATLNTAHRRLTAALVATLKAAGLPLLAYTVNDPKRAKTLFDWGVDGVFSDKPDAILAVAG
ncbi:MAG: glycerophosphodiester phosphodiesterase [Inquilinus sp.]|nr:glycerophosphodiester phosphodiesterase [Inquilinus sp.]